MLFHWTKRTILSSCSSHQCQHMTTLAVQPVIPAHAKHGTMSSRSNLPSSSINHRLASSFLAGCLAYTLLVVCAYSIPSNDTLENHAKTLSCSKACFVQARCLPLHSTHVQVTTFDWIKKM